MKILQNIWIAMMVVMVIVMLISNQQDLQASQLDNGWEDYTSEIDHLHFGDKLRETQLETGPWVLPMGPTLSYHAPDQQKIVNIAWQVSNSKDFLFTLRAENGVFDPSRQSNVKLNGKREDSWGLCQMHRKWNAHIVDDPRFFSDVRWQIEQCWEKFKINPNLFSGYRRRYSQAKYFKF